MEIGVIERILKAYGVQDATILAPQKGYRNSAYPVVLAGKTLNLILYKTESGMLTRIKNANAIADFAAHKGLPARQTASAKIIKLQAGPRIKYGALYHYLPGKTIPWEGYTMEHIKNLGKTMGQLHAALAEAPTATLPSVAQENIQLNTRMLRYFNDTSVERALVEKLNLKIVHADFKRLLQTCQDLPNHQALHMDFVRGNILFEGTNVVGILDFEKTACGNVIFDVARTLAFLYVDCKFKQPHKTYKYFLPSGYGKRGGGDLPQSDLLEQLVGFFLLHDFYKFLRHNPYENLSQNEHFIRTKAMLLKRSLIARA